MTLANIEKKARELRTLIKDAKPVLDIKGTTYYVSAIGNDENDGKTPETAWLTTNAIMTNRDKLQPGDAVLFRCGDIFRGRFEMTPGVTYSSFGEGGKPELWGADENAAELEWKKEDQENVYSLQMPHSIDIGNIVFNHGEEWGIKHLMEIDPELEMDLDYILNKDTHILYLYSEFGNPSERWDDIELCVSKTMIRGNANGVTIDGLVLKYGAAHGIGCGSIDYTDPEKPANSVLKNLTIRNCEFEWIGGGIQFRTTRFGNAFEIWGGCDNLVFENNYINQVYDAGITQQYSGVNWNKDLPVKVTNTVMRNNLIENCTYSYEYFLTEWEIDASKPRTVVKDTKFGFENVLFENNICRMAGYGWGEQRPDQCSPCHLKSWGHTNNSKNFVMKNNIFDRCDFRLIEINATSDACVPTLEGNVYCQYQGKDIVNTNGKKSIMSRESIERKETLTEEDAIFVFTKR